MIWVKFFDIESFNLWHEDVKTTLGLPKPSLNEAGEIVADAIVTDSYVLPIIVADNDIRAFIDELYADGLDTSSNPIVSKYEAAPE